MWPALALWDRTVSGRQSAVLSHRSTRELAGHLCTAVTNLAFLNGWGDRKRRNLNNFFSSPFSFFCQSCTGKRLGILFKSVLRLYTSQE